MIPGKVRIEDIDSNCKDGILRLTPPKTEVSETKRIKVK
jgi:HSP20 family molecular chaperone IbpA